MNPSQLRALLDEVAGGARRRRRGRTRRSSTRSAASPFEDLGFARVDHHRAIRQGFPEVVLGLGKTPAQIAAIAAEIVGARLDAAGDARQRRRRIDAVRAVVPQAAYYADARIIALRQQDVTPGKGTHSRSSPPARRTCPSPKRRRCTAELMGNEVERLYDVGVAGIHRLLGERARLDAARVIIVVAGMEGALPSVVSGLVAVPVIAVPTSIGYGASFGGIAALLGMLNSCASGVSVVNIDNGFGAANIASLINHL